ncbi:FCD domain-containing protein [Rubrivivax gelatinosus]|uniref:FCD domain-containing protein n=1 Tax=Rubrivivax gelatinosus TaxID=28068 RepID=UPI00030F5DBE|nr:FCD domain-containing protein [Rubrivivax gelatinosus]MBG6078391.1 phosphonate utilization transcriptional regulator [Rubrivivax gelatinosus]
MSTSTVTREAALALMQSTSLARLAAESVEALILAGELGPGARLNEAALAQRLGVSRGPLREALRLLEEGGLVRQEKNRGAFVREIPLAEAAELYELRAGLDATAGRLLATRITPEQLAELRALTAAMSAVGEHEVDRFHELNLGFHDRLVVLAGNTALLETYRRTTRLLALFRRRNLLAPRAIPRFAEEHAAIVERLAAGDAAGAGEALFAHADGGRRRMLADGELG